MIGPVCCVQSIVVARGSLFLNEDVTDEQHLD